VPLPSKKSALRVKLARIDWLGSFTLVVAVGCLLVAVTLKTAEEMPWSSPAVWILSVTSAIALVSFVFVETYVSKEPILPMRLLMQRTPACVSVTNFLLSFAGFSVLYNVPIYFTAVRLQTASQAGLHLLPNSIAVGIGSLLAGAIMRATGKYWTLTILSCVCGLASAILLSSWNSETSELRLWLDIVPAGFSLASIVTTTLIALIGSVDHEDMAVVTGISYLFRTSGQVLGVSLTGALAQSILREELRKRIHVPGAEELIREIRHTTSIIRDLEPELRDAASSSWAVALRAVFICNAAISFGMLLSCLPIQEFELPSTLVNVGKQTTQEGTGSGEADAEQN